MCICVFGLIVFITRGTDEDGASLDSSTAWALLPPPERGDYLLVVVWEKLVADEVTHFVETRMREAAEKSARFQDTKTRRLLALQEDVERLKKTSHTAEISALAEHVNELALLNAEIVSKVEKKMCHRETPTTRENRTTMPSTPRRPGSRNRTTDPRHSLMASADFPRGI
ncbi:hypothetical protein GE21DRAFT_1271383 [Neurospora crassa]|nr:hypothetical protein GE21DRAFT_1271383 [Neurospora crassa]